LEGRHFPKTVTWKTLKGETSKDGIGQVAALARILIMASVSHDGCVYKVMDMK
jgi:hypothetical protein